ncbi:MAG TPA: hypothetical protein VGE69_15040 [Pseudomonadales bacterium]
MRRTLQFIPALLLAYAGSAFAADSAPEGFNGIWLIAQETPALRTLTGELPPLLPDAQARYEQNQRDRANGDTYFDRATWCAGVGVPRLLAANHPFEIMVDKRQVGFFFEWNRWVRLVDMSGSQLEPYYPLSLGTANGAWQDDGSLVIESAGLMHETIMDHAGLPHSDDLVMTETLRLIDADTLENHIRFEDPQTFSAPWETKLTYRRQPGARLKEDVCLDRIKQGLPPI